MLKTRLIGVGFIIAIVATVLLAVTRPNPFADNQTIYAELDSVQGLGQIDRDVRVAGVNEGEIGTVKRIGDNALVELDISPDVVVHEDATVRLRPHTLFEGSGYIDLHPGSPSAPVLESGSTIPLAQTSVYVSLDEATRTFRRPIREGLAGLAKVGSKTLRGPGVKGLQETLRRAPELTKELGPTMRALRGPGGDELGGAIQGLSATTRALAREKGALTELPPHASATLAALVVDGGDPLDAAIARLPELTSQLAEGSGELTAMVDAIDRFAAGARPAARELAPALAEMRPLLRETTPISIKALPLVRGLRTILARSAAAAPALKRLVVVLKPGVKTLDRSVVPYLLSDSRLGLPVYMQLISAFASGDAAFRPYQTSAQNPLGSGHVIRLGAYFDQDFFATTGLPSCAIVAVLNPDLADQLQAFGLCSP